jgi:hypothetical protein
MGQSSVDWPRGEHPYNGWTWKERAEAVLPTLGSSNVFDNSSEGRLAVESQNGNAVQEELQEGIGKDVENMTDDQIQSEAIAIAKSRSSTAESWVRYGELLHEASIRYARKRKQYGDLGAVKKAIERIHDDYMEICGVEFKGRAIDAVACYGLSKLSDDVGLEPIAYDSAEAISRVSKKAIGMDSGTGEFHWKADGGYSIAEECEGMTYAEVTRKFARKQTAEEKAAQAEKRFCTAIGNATKENGFSYVAAHVLAVPNVKGYSGPSLKERFSILVMVAMDLGLSLKDLEKYILENIPVTKPVTKPVTESVADAV